ncbi:Ger(x)C family spore germination protein [Paenibacillus pedocola]|uniref:Ger(x)C family spore germination protein n=1 Tax=Paenibacillus pedocola TaxID=3242193 RepID=UPI002877EEB9|nr:Ger(x)C family spore germination protein [Paenibacillus typhae]
MRRKKVLLVFVMTAGLTLVNGCWNYREIDSLAIVSGVGIDRSEDGQHYVMTAEIIGFSGTGKDARIKSEHVEAKGETLFDTARNMTRTAPKKLYWSHAGVFIISQEIAREGVVPLLDYIARGTERRLQIVPMVSREETASEIVKLHSITTEVQMYALRDAIETEQKTSSKVPYVNVRDVINALSGEGVSAIMPVVGINDTGEKNASTDLAGTAVFKKEKLVGFLSPDETKWYLFAINKIKGGLIPVDVELENIHEVSLEISDNKTKIKLVDTSKKPRVKIKVHTVLSIQEIGVTDNLLAGEGLQRLKTSAEKTIQTGIEEVVKSVQKKFGTDIFGFGAALRQSDPKAWRKWEEEWGLVFSELDVQIEVDAEIRNSSVLNKSIEVRD